jgi:hypothetical protein
MTGIIGVVHEGKIFAVYRPAAGLQTLVVLRVISP